MKRISDESLQLNIIYTLMATVNQYFKEMHVSPRNNEGIGG